MKRFLISSLVALMTMVSYAATEITMAKYTWETYNGSTEIYLFSSVNIENSYIFRFAFPMEMLEADVTYTLAEMKTEGCNMSYYDSKNPLNFVPFTAASFRYSRDESGYLSILADVSVTEVGDFSLKYVESALPEAVDTTDIHISAAIFEEQLGFYSVLIQGKNADYACRIKFNTNTSDYLGTYKGLATYDEFGKLDINVTGLWKLSGKDSLAIELAYAEATLEADGDNYRVSAYMQDKDKHGYAIEMTSSLPAGLDTIAIYSTNLVMYDHTDISGHEQISFNASDEKYVISLWVYSDEPVGHFRGSQIASCSIYSTDAESQWVTLLQYGDVTITESYGPAPTEPELEPEPGIYFTITGRVYMDDGNYYELHLTDSPYVDWGQSLQTTTIAAPARKYIEHGMLMLETNGTRYNVLGQKQ